MYAVLSKGRSSLSSMHQQAWRQVKGVAGYYMTAYHRSVQSSRLENSWKSESLAEADAIRSALASKGWKQTGNGKTEAGRFAVEFYRHPEHARTILSFCPSVSVGLIPNQAMELHLQTQ